MITPADLAKALERNTRVIEMQAEGLTHADSLLQTNYNINCLNWTLGHIISYRDGMLEMLGEDRVMPTEQSERYARESDPVTEDGPDVLELDVLLGLARVAQDRLGRALAAATDEDLTATIHVGDRATTLGKRLFFGYFHDTYHTGHTELLRQIAGKNDAII